MDNGMMGKGWHWNLLAVLAIIGIAAIITAVGSLIVWLVQHVRFV